MPSTDQCCQSTDVDFTALRSLSELGIDTGFIDDLGEMRYPFILLFDLSVDADVYACTCTQMHTNIHTVQLFV